MQTSRDPMRTAIDIYNAQLLADTEDRLSMRQIAEKCGVSRSTLSDRLSGRRKPYNEAHTLQQALTPEEEICLVDYIRRMSLCGHPPAPRLVLEVADQLRTSRTLVTTVSSLPLPSLGHNWLQKLRKRHSEVTSVWTRLIDTSRMVSATPERLVPWFTEVESIINKNHYSPNNMYNMDETGYSVGTSQSTRVLFTVPPHGTSAEGISRTQKRKKKAPKAAPGKQEWITSLECVSASGVALPPLVIFKGQGLQSHWLPTDLHLQGWRWAVSHKGWSSGTLAFDWLMQVFLPSTNPQHTKERRLLIIDGHSTHLTARFISKCMTNAVDLMVLPSHTSHVTQPLDVGIFGPLKAAMARQVDRANMSYQGRVQKVDWIRDLAAARAVAMSKHNILVGWKATGLHPLNPRRVLGYSLSTPPPTIPTPSQCPPNSLEKENEAFFQQYHSCLSTPIKRRISELAATAETNRTKLTIAERQLTELREREEKTPVRRGITVKNMNTHIFTTEDVYERVKRAEERRQEAEERKATTSNNKNKGKSKVVVQSPSTDSSSRDELSVFGWSD